MISGKISYLKSVGHDSPEQPVLICPVITEGGNCILSLLNQLLLQAAIVLADGLCSLESCCSPPGFKTGVVPVSPLLDFEKINEE